MQNDRNGGKIRGRERTRQIVRRRDNYTCQTCGDVRTPEQAKKAGKRLFDVHHLKGLCGKKSKRYDKVGDVPNLITLCHKCHFNHPEHVYQTKGHDYEEIRKMRADRYTLKEIGKKFGVSGERIRQILLKNS